MTNDINVIDIFSGAGGLSEGFFKSNYKFVSHIEMDKYAAMSLETRAAYHFLKEHNKETVYYDYIKGNINRKELFEYPDLKYYVSDSLINKEISEENESSVITKIKKRMETLGVEKIQGIIGGPPCQAYSIAGRSRDPNSMKDDPRNYLYKRYLTFLREFNPEFFVFENVPGMISAKNGSVYCDFQKEIKKLGYGIYSKVLNAKEFRVLQSRRRLIVIGYKSDNFQDISFKPIDHDYKVSDVLIDLPELQAGEGTDAAQEYKGSMTEYLEKTGIRTKKDVLIQHNARNHNEVDKEIYRLAIRTWNTKRRRIKYSEIPEKLRNHRNTQSFQDRFKVVAGDLKASHTIVAHISKDGHYSIHPDIKQARSLTVREAARIQSFPDNFKFEGPRTSQYRQVGNAVPPLMAETIANKIKELLRC